MYLFGTIHLPIDSVSWNESLVHQLILQCDQYYGETNVRDLKDIGMLGANLIPDGKSIKDLFSSHKKYEKVRKMLLRSFEIDINDYGNLKPMLFQHLLDKKIAGGEGEIMDHALWQYAEGNQIFVDGLETIQDQIDILNTIDLDYQVKILKSIATNPPVYRKKIRKMVELYNAQDIEYRRLLIIDRNEIMDQKIITMPDKKIFVSVGIGHLYGNKGILALLKREGADLSVYA